MSFLDIDADRRKLSILEEKMQDVECGQPNTMSDGVLQKLKRFDDACQAAALKIRDHDIDDGKEFNNKEVNFEAMKELLKDIQILTLTSKESSA